MRERLMQLLPDLSAKQLDRFETYYEMLTDWNTRVNLTAITEKDEVAKKHFYDSLLSAPLLPEGARCIDVGTGAGFPGVALLIARPDLEMTLLDSLQKRLTFLEALLDKLGLSATLVHARAEDAGRDKAHREQYDVALSRAVSLLPVLMELTVPLVKAGGTSIAYKGDVAEELALSENAAKALSCELSVTDVTGDYGARNLVLIKKLAKTPAQYPRKAGTPAKKPL